MHRSPTVLAALGATLAAASAAAAPVITEVAWMGSDADANDEWIEIHNPGAQPEDLAGYAIIQGTTVRPLPAQSLNDGAYLVLERQATSTPLEPPAAAAFSFGAGLVNGGQALCLCAAAAASCADATCDVVNTGSAWFAGDNTAPKATMERKDPTLNGALASSWQDGTPSSPGAASPAAPVDAGPPPVDAGPPPPDAGPNNAPTVSVAEPATTVSGASVTVVYSAADGDPQDAVSVELFWSSDTSGQDGVRFARGLPAGAGQSATLETSTLPVGTWRIFARARDSRGATAFAYAPGAVQVGEGGLVEPTFELLEPDGVDDANADGTFAVQWRAELPAQAQGSVSLFVDDDADGADGDPLIGGLSAGPEGPRAFRWDPLLTETAPGTAHVYAVLDWSGGRVVAYAPAAVTVAGDGCSCGQGRLPAAQRLLAGLTLAILLVPFGRRGDNRRRG